jgi:hypothetical protein
VTVARRAPALALLVAASALASGCIGGKGGAIVVRWRLVDQATAQQFTSCDVSTPSDGTNIRVSIDRMRLLVQPFVDDGDLGAYALPDLLACTSCEDFPCSPPEHTTSFEIPEGTYRISLQALAAGCGTPVGLSAPAVVRAVRPGEVTNLDAIEIALPPGTTSCGDGGS